MIKGCVISNGAGSVRRNVYLDVGGQREDVFGNEDFAMNLAIARQFKIVATCKYFTWQRRENHGNLMTLEHTYYGPVKVLYDELLKYRDFLNKTDYKAVYQRWCRMADVLFRKLWIDEGRIKMIAAMDEFSTLIPPMIRWKWEGVSLLPSGFGYGARELKRKLKPIF